MNLTHEDKILALSTKICLSKKDKSAIESTLASQEINWHRLIGIASSCQILPLMAKNLLNIDTNFIPKVTLKRLFKNYQREYTLNNLILWNEFKKILNIANKKNITILPIKGVILTEMLYNDIGLRKTSDIDVLIKKENLLELEFELRKLGYLDDPREVKFMISRENHLKNNLHFSFMKNGFADNPVYLNLHWDILPTLTRIDNLVNDFWNNAVIRKVSEEEVLTLSLEDLLFESMIELYKDIIQDRQFLLKRLCDILRILNRYEQKINWDKFIKRVKRYGIQPLVYFALICIRELFYEDIVSEKIIYKLRPSLVKRIFILRSINKINYSNLLENFPGVFKLIYYFFICEVILLSNRWRIFFLRIFEWAFPDIQRYKNTKILNYIIVQSFKLISRFTNKILKRSLKNP